MELTREEYITPWAKKNDSDPLHSLCSYLGAFPPSLANYFIKYFTDKNDLVFDPFSKKRINVCLLAYGLKTLSCNFIIV